MTNIAKLTEKLRIAMVGSYPPPYGGVSTTLMQLAVHLKSEKHDVRVFATSPEQANLTNDIYFFSARDKILTRNLLYKLKKFNPQLIHSHASTLRTSTTLFSIILGIPLIHQVYGERFPLQYERFSVFRKWKTRWLAKQAQMIICASADLAEFFLKLGVEKSRIYTIPCLLPIEVNEIIDEFTNLNESRPNLIILLTTGYYPFDNNHYGFDLIPEIALNLQEKGVDFIWFLVGQGSELQKETYSQKLIDAKVEDRVTFIGELDRPEILKLLHQSHVYVRTKYSDSFGIVIAEAHQLGCHCLIGDNNPYFQEGDRITRYKTGDETSLTNCLLEIINQINPQGLRSMDSQFSIEAKINYENIKQVYDKIITGSKEPTNES